LIYIPSEIITRGQNADLRKAGLKTDLKLFRFNAEDRGVLENNGIDYIDSPKGLLAEYSALKNISDEEMADIRSDDMYNVRKYALFYIGLLLIAFAFTYLQVVTMGIVSENIMYDIRSDVVRHILKLSMNFFRKNPIGRLVTRTNNDIDALRQLLTDVLIYSAKDILVIVGIFAIMFRLSVPLAGIMLLLIPVLAVTLYLFQKYARRAYRKVRLSLARVNSFLSESISGMSLIQAFNKQKKSYSDFDKTSRNYYEANMFQLLIFSIFRPLIDVLSFVTLGTLIYFGGNAVLEGVVTVGVLIAFISYVRKLFRPIFDFSEKFNIFQSAMASSERIMTILDEDDYIKSPEESKFPDNARGKVEFRNVTFSYKEDEPVLKDVSFTIEPNESVAFVGSTGAGKTTIINLLMRFYDIDEGQILIDDVDIRDMNLDDLRSYFGLVLQDVIMFSGDIKYNIALNKDVEDEKIVQYSKYVNAHTFISKLDKQYRDTVAESGKNLSTGQRQLIAFARALAIEPQILILDEATSSIDSETESLIQDAISRIMHDRTSIAIAHRLSTIQDADRIYVLHKGRIVESGTHQELLKQNDKYAELYKYQYIE
ncbi:MAG: ABC transporter ATP-binding protein, partial [candidate division WOR-3 bacterium]|nr:ABC transporter ATP-binding protein [candidate division WOR-3 bacterium]